MVRIALGVMRRGLSGGESGVCRAARGCVSLAVARVVRPPQLQGEVGRWVQPFRRKGLATDEFAGGCPFVVKATSLLQHGGGASTGHSVGLPVY